MPKYAALDPERDATTPQSALPPAIPAWKTIRYTARARARTQPGLACWAATVSVESTETQATPPTSMIGQRTTRLRSVAAPIATAANARDPPCPGTATTARRRRGGDSGRARS